MATIAQRRTRLGAGLAYRTVWTATLRAYRIPILAWGIGLGLIVMATAAASPEQAKVTADLGQAQQYFRFLGNPVAI